MPVNWSPRYAPRNPPSTASRRTGTPYGGAKSAEYGGAVIVVTNEVGSGIVPDNAISRRFRDCAGRANQVIAREADELYFMVAGIPMRMKPRGKAGING